MGTKYLKRLSKRLYNVFRTSPKTFSNSSFEIAKAIDDYVSVVIGDVDDFGELGSTVEAHSQAIAQLEDDVAEHSQAIEQLEADVEALKSGEPIPGVDAFAGFCTVDDVVGNLVYMFGTGKQVRKIDIENSEKMPAIGCIVSKESDTECVVQTGNLIGGVYLGLNPGKIMFAGLDAMPVETVSRGVVERYVQAVGFAIDSSLINLSPSTLITKIAPE